MKISNTLAALKSEVSKHRPAMTAVTIKITWKRESAESNSSNSTAEDLSESNQPTSVRNAVSIVNKKSSSQEQRCGKCEKKMVNGVRCSDSGKEVHWRCGRVTEDKEKAKIIESSYWSCIECQSSAIYAKAKQRK